MSLKALRGFLGLTGYYRHFVRNYASLATPLTDLLRTDQFHSTPAATKAFTTLKHALTTALVLALPYFSKAFEITTDASSCAIGAVLSQQGHPLAYFSKKMGPQMSSASAYTREMYAITEAVKK